MIIMYFDDESNYKSVTKYFPLIGDLLYINTMKNGRIPALNYSCS